MVESRFLALGFWLASAFVFVCFITCLQRGQHIKNLQGTVANSATGFQDNSGLFYLLSGLVSYLRDVDMSAQNQPRELTV